MQGITVKYQGASELITEACSDIDGKGFEFIYENKIYHAFIDYNTDIDNLKHLCLWKEDSNIVILLFGNSVEIHSCYVSGEAVFTAMKASYITDKTVDLDAIMPKIAAIYDRYEKCCADWDAILV